MINCLFFRYFGAVRIGIIIFGLFLSVGLFSCENPCEEYVEAVELPTGDSLWHKNFGGYSDLLTFRRRVQTNFHELARRDLAGEVYDWGTGSDFELITQFDLSLIFDSTDVERIFISSANIILFDIDEDFCSYKNRWLVYDANHYRQIFPPGSVIGRVRLDPQLHWYEMHVHRDIQPIGY